jgi:hypothetical protein
VTSTAAAISIAKRSADGLDGFTAISLFTGRFIVLAQAAAGVGMRSMITVRSE